MKPLFNDKGEMQITCMHGVFKTVKEHDCSLCAELAAAAELREGPYIFTSIAQYERAKLANKKPEEGSEPLDEYTWEALRSGEPDAEQMMLIHSRLLWLERWRRDMMKKHPGGNNG